MTTLAHISDIHLGPMPRVAVTDLVGKRLTGYLNWKMMRRDTLSGEGLTNLVRHMQAQTPDFIAVTGDLTNLALPVEIDRAGEWLKSVGPTDLVCVAPGNHDAYVPGALERAERGWGGYLQGETLDNTIYPFVRRIGDIAIITCSSAIPTKPFMAIGQFDEAQAERLGRFLDSLDSLFRVVLIHHPPNPELQNPSFGLKGYRLFCSVIKEHGAELVLHGHTHRSSIHNIPGKGHDVPVIGVAAAGAAQGGAMDDPARYNWFEVERNGDGWSCTMREFGYQKGNMDIVMRMQMRIY